MTLVKEMVKHREFFLDDYLNKMKNPDTIINGYKDRKIAQKIIRNRHFIRIIFIEDLNSKRIITVYPVKRSRYENKV